MEKRGGVRWRMRILLMRGGGLVSGDVFGGILLCRVILIPKVGAAKKLNSSNSRSGQPRVSTLLGLGPWIPVLSLGRRKERMAT